MQLRGVRVCGRQLKLLMVLIRRCHREFFAASRLIFMQIIGKDKDKLAFCGTGDSLTEKIKG